MKDYLPDGYRWASMFEKQVHARRAIPGAIKVPVKNTDTTLTKKLAVPA